ncbi:NTP transferase domain-containing protein [Pelagicoccus sp. SDUM812002]|uniref:nucleotidyltransferase family protein n=1 Tax=Pelagicoccus sp. SDUM812002 TaxID=3041266 RepID=UPI00280C8052|nr:NTP transferase domain-containing protein [Pelagicoccus sp. SDUM812002]MDQ8187892.1 NTP transferase domain-containing protein [Pelagicoccus sp. SDUM812002]
MQPILLVLAAGMGSRFGGLKQMAPVGPQGEWILDYSVLDASRAGFGKIVFVIRHEMEEEFRRLTEDKYSGTIELAYAFQEITDTPVSVPNIEQRQKPWGTGHAVYAARQHLDAPFAVINADDFYGAEAFQTLAKFLGDSSLQSEQQTYGLVGYRLSNTLSKHGTVSRGICEIADDHTLLSIEEHSEIGYRADETITAVNEAGEELTLSPDTLVSLNCWGFPLGWAAQLEPLFTTFLEGRGTEAKSEFYLPAAVDQLIKAGGSRTLALPCDSRWLGVTYREDLPSVRNAIAALCAEGAY